MFSFLFVGVLMDVPKSEFDPYLNLNFMDTYPNGYSKKRIWIIFLNIRRNG
ncbi:hypothetical protein LguiB_027188 [Lonicera macranthoides]